MAEGGIYDHLGGGFHRYSTERTWTVPHFEKMLYDNAQLVELYGEAYAITPDPTYQRVVDETLAFVEREMTSPGRRVLLRARRRHEPRGGRVLRLDARRDREGARRRRGRFFTSVYGDAPNFEEKSIILRLPKPLAEVAKEQKLTEAELLAKLEPLQEEAVRRAGEARAAVPRHEGPHGLERPDDRGLRAGRAGVQEAGVREGRRDRRRLRPRRRCATRTAGSSASTPPCPARSRRARNRLPRRLRLPRPRPAQPARRDRREEVARRGGQLTDLAIKWHGDGDKGGFFFAPSDDEKLFARAKDEYDGVQPSGNSQMARNLLRLALEDGQPEVPRSRCEKTIKQFALTLRMNPGSVPTMALCLDEYVAAGGTSATAPAGRSKRRRTRRSRRMW